MSIQKVHVIVNLANQENDSILTELANGFNDSSISWKYSIVDKHDNTEAVVEKFVDSVDLIAVYGGDGTVTRVSHSLINKPIPLAILPSGTANVIAKEFGVPVDIKKAIGLIGNNFSQIKCVDTGLCNGNPFLIRVNFGLMADMVIDTQRSMKNTFGQLAYGITAMETLSDLKTHTYKLKIDGKEIEQEAVLLTVTNLGNIGAQDFSLLPDIKCDDGLFDVILLDHADFLSMMRVAGSTLLQTESNVLKRWKCKEIAIELKKSQRFICDDKEVKGRNIEIEVVPTSIRILVPFLKAVSENESRN